MKKFIKAFIVIPALLLAYGSSNAQCGSFAKKKCLPNLSPYTPNGQVSSSHLGEGESAELMMTFYSGQNYRLMVCHEPNIEGVYFKLKDIDHKEIYSSKEKENNYFDFNVKNTQQMYVEVIVPEPKKSSSKGGHDMVHSGCVSIVVGFKTH